MIRDTDYIGQIVNYLKSNLKKGYTKESLRWALVNQNHSRIEIERAFKEAEKQLASEAPILKTKPVIKYEIVENTTNVDQDEPKKPFWKRFFS
jgi:hypothetical protein